MKTFRVLCIAFTLTSSGAVPLPGLAQTPASDVRLAFVPYAAAFSLESRQPELVDPLVFVIAPHVPPATGLLGIAHFPGIRNALMADDPMQPALDANGKPLGFDLQHWFGATGIVELAADDSGRDRITTQFANLVPNGRYSLFATRAGAPGAVLPLDGSGRANSFTAAPDGTGGLALVSSAPAHGSAIELVFHSDHTDHGLQRGEIGIYAHVQLVARVP